jgi:hypothetical protein
MQPEIEQKIAIARAKEASERLAAVYGKGKTGLLKQAGLKRVNGPGPNDRSTGLRPPTQASRTDTNVHPGSCSLARLLFGS